jgi:hypothetical protein
MIFDEKDWPHFEVFTYGKYGDAVTVNVGDFAVEGVLICKVSQNLIDESECRAL